jgi:EmrB/QacA subfamily drug resistance transporter
VIGEPERAVSRGNLNNKTLALAISSVSVFVMAFMVPALNVALPSIGQQFGANAIVLGWMVTAYVVAIAVFSIPVGRLSDIVGIKKIFIYGLVVYTLSSIMIAFSSSSIMVIIGRALQGIGASMVMVNSLAMLTAIYPAKDRGRALGISLGCIFVGSTAGPFLGGVLTENLGWESIFLSSIPIGLILIVLLLFKIRGEWRESRGEKFDYIGSSVYGFALVALMYGFSILPAVLGGILILAGIILLVAFFKMEGRIKSPALNIGVFRNNRPFLLSCLSALIYFSAVAAVVFLISLYLQYIKGITAQLAGLVLVAQPVVQAVLSPFTGQLSDKVEPRIIATGGIALTCLGLLLFAFLKDDSPLFQVIIALIITGAGFALFVSPNTNAIMSSVTPRFLGVASATMSTMISVGQMLGLGITMIVMALIIGRVEITSEYYPAFLTSSRVAFAVFTGLCFGGIFASLLRGKIHKGA